MREGFGTEMRGGVGGGGAALASAMRQTLNLMWLNGLCLDPEMNEEVSAAGDGVVVDFSHHHRRGGLAPYEVAFIIRRIQRQPYANPASLIATPHRHAHLVKHRSKSSKVSSLGVLRGALGVSNGLPTPSKRLRSLDLRGNQIRPEQASKIKAACKDKEISVEI